MTPAPKTMALGRTRGRAAPRLGRSCSAVITIQTMRATPALALFGLALVAGCGTLSPHRQGLIEGQRVFAGEAARLLKERRELWAAFDRLPLDSSDPNQTGTEFVQALHHKAEVARALDANETAWEKHMQTWALWEIAVAPRYRGMELWGLAHGEWNKLRQQEVGPGPVPVVPPMTDAEVAEQVKKIVDKLRRQKQERQRLRQR